MRPGLSLFGKRHTQKSVDHQQIAENHKQKSVIILDAEKQRQPKRRALSPCGRDPPFRMPVARPACIPVGFPYFVDGIEETVIQVGGPRFLGMIFRFAD